MCPSVNPLGAISSSMVPHLAIRSVAYGSWMARGWDLDGTHSGFHKKEGDSLERVECWISVSSMNQDTLRISMYMKFCIYV
jgi:hypothetical protein